MSSTLTLLVDDHWLNTDLPDTGLWGPQHRRAFNQISLDAKVLPVSKYLPNSDVSIYTIVISSRNQVFDFNLIPYSTVEIIRRDSLPILLFFPLEYIHCETNLRLAASAFKERFPTSKLLILSLTFNLPEQKNYLKETEISETIRFIPSVLFLSPTIQTSNFNFQYAANTRANTAKKVFVCLNGASRIYRRILVHLFYTANLLPYGIVTENNPARVTLNSIRVLLQNFANDLPLYIQQQRPELNKDFIIDFLESVKKNEILPDLILDGPPNEFYKGKNIQEYYESTWCSVITETTEVTEIADSLDYYYYNIGPMITEKTTKSLLTGHPFLVVGNRKSQYWLHSLGFKTFEKTWFDVPDEFDEIDDVLLKCTYVIESLSRLVSLTPAELNEKFNSVINDIEHNKNHLLNTNWHKVQLDLILDSLREMPVPEK